MSQLISPFFSSSRKVALLLASEASRVRCAPNQNVRTSMQEQPNNPLHGLSLQTILTRLVEHYSWSGLYQRIRVNCFHNDPSIKSSLKFCAKRSGREIRSKPCILTLFAKGKIDNAERMCLGVFVFHKITTMFTERPLVAAGSALHARPSP